MVLLQATSRLLRSLVGVRKTAPTPSEVVQPATACRDVYRLLHENIQQLRGSFKHSPLSAEVCAGCCGVMQPWQGAGLVPCIIAGCHTAGAAQAIVLNLLHH